MRVLLAVALLIVSVPSFAADIPRPTVIIPPSGGMPTYVYPGGRPGLPTTVLPPTGLPSYVYPSPMPTMPAVVLPPTGGMPTYVYPGSQPIEVAPLLVLPPLGE